MRMSQLLFLVPIFYNSKKNCTIASVTNRFFNSSAVSFLKIRNNKDII